MAGWPAMFQPQALSSQCGPWSGGSRTFNLTREKWTLGRCIISCWTWWISISILDYPRVSILGIQNNLPSSRTFLSQGTPNGEARPEHRCLFVGRATAGVVRNSIRMSHRYVMSSIWLPLSPTSFVLLTYGFTGYLELIHKAHPKYPTSTSSSVTAPGRPLNAKMRSIITSSACRKSR